MGKKYTTDEIEVGGHMLDASMMSGLNTIVSAGSHTLAGYLTTYTDTTYSVGNGGLTEINFTSALNTKLAGIATGANNYVLPFTNNSANWNTAYGWGNHASAGYSGYNFGASDLTFEGTNPGDIVWRDGAGSEVHRIWSGTNNYLTYRNNAGTAYGIIHEGFTGYNNTNWDTAYGWGNHAGLYAASSHNHTWASIASNSVNGWGGLRHTTSSGYIDFGPANANHAHIYTDRPNFYFNKSLTVNGSSVVNTSDIRSKIFYDVDNTGYYIHPASTSNLNGLTVNGTITGTTSGNIKQINTSSGNIDSDWGTSFKTFDPIPSGTPPLQSPNIRTINIGENFERRTQLAFDYATDRAFFRRRQGTTWYAWNEFYHTGNLTLATLGYTGATNANYITNNNQLTNGASYLTTSGKAADSELLDGINSTSFLRSDQDYETSNGRLTMNGGIGFPASNGGTYSRGSDSYGIYQESGAWSSPFPDLNIGFHTGISIGAHPSYGGVRFFTNSDMITQIMSVGNGNDGMGSGYVYVNEGLEAGSSLRAPIFYDSNNTGYYLNPASTSLMNRLELDSDLDMRAQAGTWVTSNVMSDAIGWNASYGVYIGSNIGGTHYLRGNGTFTTDGSTYNLYHTGNFTPSNYLLTSGKAADSNLLDGIDSTQFLRSDADDTVSAGVTYTWARTDDAGIVFTNNTYNTQLAMGGWTATNSSNISRIRTSSGNLHIDSASDGALYLNWYSGGAVKTNSILQSDSSLRAPIFYDSNDTGFYLNPASTSNLYEINSSGGVTFTNFGIGVTGTYASTRLQTIFNMGAAYKISSGGDAVNNAYGLYWSHQNAGTLGGANNLASHGLIILEGGTYKGSWGGGRLVTTGDVRAPIFYDSNNTNYYVNPNGESNLFKGEFSQLGLFRSPDASTSSYKLAMGGNIHMYNNTIDYVAQLHFQDNVRFYDDGNDSYLNFKYGDATTGGIKFLNGGGTVKGYVFANAESFGLLDAGGNWAVKTAVGAAPLTLSSNSNPEFYVYDSYTVSPGSSRAPIFYDYNNTGYYLDPTSTSVLSNLILKTTSGSTRIEIESANNWSYCRYKNGASVRFDTGVFQNGNYEIRPYGASSNRTYFDYSGNSFSEASKRAPIFYDSDNTGRYINASGTSLMNSIVFLGNSTPIVSKYSGKKSWVQHITDNAYIFAPSTAIDGTSWDWPNQTRFDANGTVTAKNFILSSDERLKTKIVDLSCDNIDVNWKSFEMTSSEGEYRTGVIAQELEQKHPEFVNTDDKGFKSVKYIDLLIAKIAELEARLEKLEK